MNDMTLRRYPPEQVVELAANEPALPQVLSGLDGPIRWKEGERLDTVFEELCARYDRAIAVETADESLTYRDLDERANRLARYLIGAGVRPGDRVALLLDKSADTYVALFAVLKAGAAYVPLDANLPVDRMRFILDDASVRILISQTTFAGQLTEIDCPTILLDAVRADVDSLPADRLVGPRPAAGSDQVCYILYTSGTTGRPKGVVIEHPSICNFTRVAAEAYGYRPGDRVYQGMSIAFDFSVEEIWVPLFAGATLIPGKSGGSLIGEELAEFLEAREVTCLACVPTLLATIDRELPKLRLLLVGGEACPQHLVVRWHRSGRVILNSYGPTEGTVTATVATLYPGRPVTIGRPLPTYSIVILDPETDAEVAPGETGEIGIGGIGVAAGYLNLPDLTAQKFIPDFLQLPNNPSGRIYRTGDLGRINAAGDIEYLGRIDTQVKIRGYRIELTEIESALLALPQIAQAVVKTYEPVPGLVELGRVLFTEARRPRGVAEPYRGGTAQTAAPLHGAGIPRGTAGHSDADQQQG